MAKNVGSNGGPVEELFFFFFFFFFFFKLHERGGVDPDDVSGWPLKPWTKFENNMGVLSLSADPFNVLMWSHYAQSHTGVLLSFRNEPGTMIGEARGGHL